MRAGILILIKESTKKFRESIQNSSNNAEQRIANLVDYVRHPTR